MVDIAFSAWLAAIVCLPLALQELDAPRILQGVVSIVIAAIGMLIWFYGLRLEVPAPWGPGLNIGLMLATIAGAIGTVWISVRDMSKDDAADGHADPDRPVSDNA